MDPATASVLVAFIASAGAIAGTIVNARSNSERLNDKDRIRRLEREVERLGGDPSGV